MCPTPPTDIGPYWTDDEILMCLERAQNGSGPLPSNVLADINPFNLMPQHLPPGEFWYFVGKGEKKDAGTGIWKVRGEPSRIFSNSSIVGLRTTLEFYEGQTPDACKTVWLMQEYRIIQKGPCENRKLQESSSMCRVFSSGGQSSSHENQNLTTGDGAVGNQIYDMGSVASKAKSNCGQEVNSRSQLQGKLNVGTTLVADSGRRMRPNAENLVEHTCISEGDFLELQDLGSSSFSSENSSRGTMSSDECFDSLALLQGLDNEINQDPHFYVFPTRLPNKVVLRPAQSECLSSSGDRSKLVANEITKIDHHPPGSATKNNFLIEKVSSSHETKTKPKEKPASSRVEASSSASGNRKKKVSPAHETKTEPNEKPPSSRVEASSSASGSRKTVAQKKKVSSAHETKTKPKEKAGSSRVEASSSTSGSQKKANICRKRKSWIKQLCFFPF